jgi:glycosyltransferase involved in cell wall biosynthesis
MITTNKPYITIVAPCYNEATILENNIKGLIQYLQNKSEKYNWDILIINDGSKDTTATIANNLAEEYKSISVIHHPTNLNLGNVIKTGFNNAKGDIIVVIDIDLSYACTHIETMVDTLVQTSADIVMASPYMKGGKLTAVPFLRKIMSIWVNKFMRFAAQDKYYTFTGMVRAYRKTFVQTLNLKTRDYEINPEIVYKATILRAKIIEIPAHLDWTEQNKFAGKRTSSLRVLRGFFSGLMSGFIFRPYIFFMGIGAFLMALSLYELVWLFYDTLADLANAKIALPNGEHTFSNSLSLQFKKNPQTFVVGGISFVIAIQFLSLGFLSLQNKRYFEELFHLGTSLKKQDKNTNPQ